jgi:hypothetical protein
LKKTNDIFTPEGAKTRDKPTTELNKFDVPSYYSYSSPFNEHLCKTLAKPILNALAERKQNLKGFTKELNKSGHNFSYSSLTNTLRGKNPYVKNFSYFAILYYHLDLPFPSLEYLNSFD